MGSLCSARTGRIERPVQGDLRDCRSHVSKAVPRRDADPGQMVREEVDASTSGVCGRDTDREVEADEQLAVGRPVEVRAALEVAFGYRQRVGCAEPGDAVAVVVDELDDGYLSLAGIGSPVCMRDVLRCPHTI